MNNQKNGLHDEIQDNLEQEQISKMLDAFAGEPGEWLCDVNNRSKDYRPSKKLQRRVMNKIRKNASPRRVKLKTALLVAALIALLLAVTASAARSAIGNFFITVRDEYLSYHDNSESPDQYIALSNVPMPEYIPAGFEQVNQVTLEGINKLFFSNTLTDITYIVYESKTALNVDVENALVEQQLWNGVNSYIITKGGQITIFWNHSFELIAPVELREELLRMAHSVSIPPVKAGDE